MPNSKKHCNAPFSFRLSPQEWAQLDHDCADLSRSEYVRRCLFGQSLVKRKKLRKAPTMDEKIAAQILGKLAQTRYANNLNQMAKSANIGALIMTPETEAAILEACANIHAIKSLLSQTTGSDS